MSGLVAFAYAPRPGPLGRARPAVAALYLGPLAAIAFAFSNPIVLLAAGAAAAAIAHGSGALRPTLAPLRYGLPFAAAIALINALVSQRGETLLVRGWELPVIGRTDLTAEALAEGGVLALRVLVALLVFAVWSACVDPDRVLKGLRPLASRSALTATLISRLIPLAAADAERLTAAARLRGPAAAPAGRGAITRRLIAGALDRSVDVAATLELRGYGLETRLARARPRRARGEPMLAAAGVALAIVALSVLTAGGAGFDAYPTVELSLGPSTWALSAAILATGLLVPLRRGGTDG